MKVCHKNIVAEATKISYKKPVPNVPGLRMTGTHWTGFYIKMDGAMRLLKHGEWVVTDGFGCHRIFSSVKELRKEYLLVA